MVGPAAALAEVEALTSSGELDGYPYVPAVHANLLLRLGRLSRGHIMSIVHTAALRVESERRPA